MHANMHMRACVIEWKTKRAWYPCKIDRSIKFEIGFFKNISYPNIFAGMPIDRIN